MGRTIVQRTAQPDSSSGRKRGFDGARAEWVLSVGLLLGCGRYGGCQDMIECMASAPCGQLPCLNLEGSFACNACAPGLAVTMMSNVSGYCSDVDECAQNSSLCGVNGSLCQNYYGGYVCVLPSCPSGYRLNM